MSKFYTMQDCFDACDDNDSPMNCDDGCEFNNHMPQTKKELFSNDFLTIPPKAISSDKWQIKKNDPVALSDDELILKHGNWAYNDKLDLFHISRQDLLTFIKVVKQNCQLREWQIKKNDPVAYPVLEITEKCLETDGRGGEPSAFEVALVCEGDKNGQLREWQRPEQIKLREALREALNDPYYLILPVMHRVVKAFENLEPPPY